MKRRVALILIWLLGRVVGGTITDYPLADHYAVQLPPTKRHRRNRVLFDQGGVAKDRVMSQRTEYRHA